MAQQWNSLCALAFFEFLRKTSSLCINVLNKFIRIMNNSWASWLKDWIIELSTPLENKWSHWRKTINTFYNQINRVQQILRLSTNFETQIAIFFEFRKRFKFLFCSDQIVTSGIIPQIYTYKTRRMYVYLPACSERYNNFFSPNWIQLFKEATSRDKFITNDSFCSQQN